MAPPGANLVNAADLPLAPHSAETEAAVLGALLLDNRAWSRVCDLLTAGDFYTASHRAIWSGLDALLREGAAVDVLTLADSLRGSGELDNVGGLAYLHQLAQGTPSAANIRRYAEIVVDHARRRDLAAIAIELQNAAMRPGADIRELRQSTERKLATIHKAAAPAPALNLPDLAGRVPPDRAWALLYWIILGHPHLLVGAGGIGKSTFLLQLAVCLTLARYFIDSIPASLKVLLWACEDDADELWRRLLCVARWLDVPLEDLAGRLIIAPRHGMDNVLITSEFGRLQFTPTMQELRAQALDTGAQVVMLDNLAHVYGADENRRHDVTFFLNGLAGALPGIATILAGHPSRSLGSEFSGSSAWENAVRCRLYLGRSLPDQPDEDDAGDDAVRYLARRKANYSARDWRRFRFADGVLVPDAVELDGAGIVGQLREARAERVVLDAARRLAEMGLRFTDGSTSPQFLPRLILEYKLAQGCSKSQLAAAMREAMLAGSITRAVVGNYSNRSPMYGLKVTA